MVFPAPAEDGAVIADIVRSGLESMITMEKAFAADETFVSATCTVKLIVPAVVGAPDMTPVEPFNVKPSGRLPEEIDHEYGGLPPVAVRVWLYVVLVLPEGRDGVVILSGSIAKDAVTVQSAVIRPVVYTVPVKDPLHPVTETIW